MISREIFLKIKKMLIPVRCYTCNKVIGNLDQPLREWKASHPGEDLEPFFEMARLTRYCCRRILLTFYSEDQHGHQHSAKEVPDTIDMRMMENMSTPQKPRLFVCR